MIAGDHEISNEEEYHDLVNWVQLQRLVMKGSWWWWSAILATLLLPLSEPLDVWKHCRRVPPEGNIQPDIVH